MRTAARGRMSRLPVLRPLQLPDEFVSRLARFAFGRRGSLAQTLPVRDHLPSISAGGCRPHEGGYFATGSPSRREERKPPGQRRLLNDRRGQGPIAVESEVASQTCDTGLRSAGPRRPQQPSDLSDAAGRRSVVFELRHALHGVLGRAGKHDRGTSGVRSRVVVVVVVVVLPVGALHWDNNSRAAVSRRIMLPHGASGERPRKRMSKIDPPSQQLQHASAPRMNLVLWMVRIAGRQSTGVVG